MAESDIESLRQLRNREENRKNFIYQKEISYESQVEWFKSYYKKSDDYMYSIISELDDSPIGFAAIYNINNSIGEFGRLLVDKHKYKQSGLGKCMVMKLIEIAKYTLHLEKLILNVFSDNIPALTIYKQCGFKEYDEENIAGRNLIHMELYL